MRRQDSVQWVCDENGRQCYTWVANRDQSSRENRMFRMKLNTLVILSLVVIGIFVISVECKNMMTFEISATKDEDHWKPDTSVPKSQFGGILKTKLDPRKTWQHFQRSAARNERKSKKASRHLKSATLYSQGPPGPRGPRGPRGMRGPQGSNVTKEEMVQIVREVFRENTQKDIWKESNAKCTELCISNMDDNSTESKSPAAFDVEQSVIIPKVASAFLWELTDHVIVQRKSFIELQRFHKAFASGRYQRDTADYIESGRFEAPVSGFYTFHVRLHLQLRIADAEVSSNINNELFSVLLCIDSLCQKNTNLETISSFGAGHRTTVSISGLLFLKEKQYASIFLDNSSRHGLKVFQGSQFSGYLIGV